MAAARDDLGRLRVLDGTGTNVYAWILDANGSYVSEEGPADTSIGTLGMTLMKMEGLTQLQELILAMTVMNIGGRRTLPLMSTWPFGRPLTSLKLLPQEGPHF